MKSTSRPKSGSSLREVFPRKVLLEAKRLGTTVQPREIANRSDVGAVFIHIDHAGRCDLGSAQGIAVIDGWEALNSERPYRPA